eukprot:5988250-Amphidinium_carterae.1
MEAGDSHIGGYERMCLQNELAVVKFSSIVDTLVNSAWHHITLIAGTTTLALKKRTNLSASRRLDVWNESLATTTPRHVAKVLARSRPVRSSCNACAGTILHRRASELE